MNKEGKIISKYFVIVIGTDEEIEMTKKGYKMLIEAFAENTVPQQVAFRDHKGKLYMEQKHNMRMRETSEVIY